MTIQLVAMTSIRSDAENAVQQYLKVVGPLMKAAGAKIVHRYELQEGVVGDNEIQYVSVIEYPDEASVRLVFDSDEYRSLTEVKRQAFSSYQVNVAVAL